MVNVLCLNVGYESDDLHQSDILYEGDQAEPDHSMEEKALKDTHVKVGKLHQ